ncbi:MAG: helix-turn-helix transcriptional regulator [Anaerovoracaceae bacterium]|jgi:putative transcriptional regulator
MDNEKIAKRLTKLRGAKGQAEVAKSVGISTSALSMYECGERIPRDEIKKKLAQYYKVSIEELFFNE